MQLAQLLATVVLASFAAALPNKRQTTPFTMSFAPFDTGFCEMQAAIPPHQPGAPGTTPTALTLTEEYCTNAPYMYGSFVTSVPSNQTYRLTSGAGCQLSLYPEENCGSATNATTVKVESYATCDIPGGTFQSVLVSCSTPSRY